MRSLASHSVFRPAMHAGGAGRHISPRLAAWLLYAFVLIINVVDVWTAQQVASGESLTAGQLVKSGMFVLLLLYDLRLVKRYPILYVFYGLFAYILAVEAIGVIRHNNVDFMIRGPVFASKALFPFLWYVFLRHMLDLNLLSPAALRRSFVLYVALFSVNIIIPVMLGVSQLNYTSSGYTGFYSAGNELGTFVTVSLPIMIYLTLSSGYRWIVYAPLTAVLVVAGVLTGAKTPLLAGMFSFAAVPALMLRHFRTALVVMAALAAAPLIYLVENLDLIAAYLPSDIFGRLIQALTERSVLWDILLGVRIEFLGLYLHEIATRDFMGVLFGLGFMNSADFMEPIVGGYHAAEMDAIDILSRYGLVGFAVVVGIVIYTVRAHYDPRIMYSRVVTFMLLMLTANALLAGHVFGNAFCTVVLGTVFAYNYGIRLPGDAPR